MASGAVCFLVVLVASALAQTVPTHSRSIEDVRAQIATDSGLDETQKTAANRLLDTAAADERAATDFDDRAGELRAAAESAPGEIARLERSLSIERRDDLSAWLSALPRNASAETLERLLARETDNASAAYAEMERLSSELQENQAQSVQNTQGLILLRQEVDRLDGSASLDGPALLIEARQLANLAKQRRMQAEIAFRQTEQDTATIRQHLLETRIREVRNRLLRWTPRLEILKDRVADRSRAELSRQQTLMEQHAATLRDAGGAPADMATANAETAGELTEQNDRLARERDELLDLSFQQAEASQALRDTRIRLDLGGDTETVGLLLRSERSKLLLPSRLARRLDEVRRELTQTRLRLATSAEAQRESSDRDSALAAVRADPDVASDDDASALDAGGNIGPLLSERIDLLGQMENLLRRRVTTLERIETTLASLLADTRALSQILDQRLLWIPSHTAVGADWIAQLPAGAQDLMKPSRFVTTANLIHRSWQERPFAYLGSTLLVVILFLLRTGVRPRLEALAQPGRSIATDNYRYTLRAFGWTLLAALPWATLLFLSGWLLQGVGDSGKYSDSLGRAVSRLAAYVFVFDFLRWLSIERGLAHAHFRWTRQRRQTLQSWLPRLAALVLPLLFVVLLAFIRNQDLAINTQARIAIVLLCLFVAWAAWAMLAPGALWTPRGQQPEPSTARRFLRAAIVALLLVTAGLALVGYVYTAGMFAEAFIRTIGVIVLIALVQGMIGRWLLLGERRLMQRRAEQKRTARLAELAASGEGAVSEPAEEPVEVETISAQTQRLLRVLTLTLLVFGLLWTWSPVLPALAYLDEIELWRYGDAADPLQSGTVTLFKLAAGALVLMLTVVATRNLPGLIELGLLSRIRLDAASRYAITSVARYAIVVIGTIVGLGLLGLRWSQLQWLAAALTVGLGFGLQEIFANFVSGLILLFERPFRIGDQITIGEFTGTVTRIRTRATTLHDGDGREIFVPNKAFITGQLINWTLSDTVTQVVLAIRVAPDSDVDRVHALLKQAAEQNSRVLANPAAASTFQGITDGALDFELRVAVGTLADRGAVRNELNGFIARLFAENGIAFASPQMNLHVRDLPADWKAVG